VHSIAPSPSLYEPFEFPMGGRFTVAHEFPSHRCTNLDGRPLAITFELPTAQHSEAEVHSTPRREWLSEVPLFEGTIAHEEPFHRWISACGHPAASYSPTAQHCIGDEQVTALSELRCDAFGALTICHELPSQWWIKVCMMLPASR
jgi:hypothetical protein